jgi:long-chain fatty acid transport protein
MRKTQLLVALAAIGFAGSALATNGYFSHGYGMKAKGMGGAATAMAADTFGGANNPASMVWVGDRIDLGADLFSPKREYSRKGSAGGAGFMDGSVDSDSEYFVIPEFGYNKMLNNTMSLGVSVYGNGGMNTDYPGGQLDAGMCQGKPPSGQPANMLCGSGKLGVDLMQLVIAPTVAYKVNESHSIGVAPLLGYQRFKAKGLNAFAPISNNPNHLSGEGYDDSYGVGVRLGYMGKLTDTVTIGAAYASKMSMSEFNKYRGLFAEEGDFDLPSNWNVGIAFQASPQIKIALDYQRINYSDVASINNTSQPTPLNPKTMLGGDDGIGFGWQDVDVIKLGIEYAYSKNLTLRAGYNHGDNPIKSRDVTFNSVAPGVIEDHVTLGFTYVTASGGELTMAYMHAFENDVKGSVNQYFPVGGTDKIKMHQDSIGIAYGWKM